MRIRGSKGVQADRGLARGDIVSFASEQSVSPYVFGEGHVTVAKYLPIVIGAGGRDVDAHDEVMRMLELDPSEPNANVPTFKNRDMPDRPAFTDDIRDLTQSFDGRNRRGTRRSRRT